MKYANVSYSLKIFCFHPQSIPVLVVSVVMYVKFPVLVVFVL